MRTLPLGRPWRGWAALVATLAGVLAAAPAAAGCPPGAGLQVSVVAEHHPPVVQSSYSLNQLRAMAAEAGHQSAHPPLGFYAGMFGYSVDVRGRAVRAPGCAADVEVQVNLILHERVVEVGVGGPCEADGVASHYLLHGAQDDRLLSRYAALARARLDAARMSGLLAASGAGNGSGALIAVVRSIMDELLEPFDADRKQALAAADTPEELARLRALCGRDA